MGPYWLLFLIPAWGTLVPTRLPMRQAAWMWVLVGILFAVMLGLRHEVGGDWFNYIRQFEQAGTLTISEAAAMPDPGYSLLSWLVGRLGGEMHWVNFVCASVLMWGTITFCRTQPQPWLALLAAVPYMLLVVGMGYTRQSVALGFALLGLVALADARIRVFVLFIALGAMFHKSAVLLLPIAALAATRNRWLTGFLVLVSTVLMYYLLLEQGADQMWKNYVKDQMQSQGGAIRVAMNALPALILLFWLKRLVPDPAERRLWLWMALFALACIPLVSLASTAVDRVALYLIPLQMFVFARLPRLARTTQTRTPLVLGIVGYYAGVQFVWLNYAGHAYAWVPYGFMPLW